MGGNGRKALLPQTKSQDARMAYGGNESSRLVLGLAL